MRRLVAVLIGVLVGGLLCEGVTRLLAERLLSLSLPTVRFDPQLGWVQSAGATAVRHNEEGQEIVIKGSSLGIREPSQPYVTQGRRNVLVLGDSLTAGTQVRFEDTWSARLQELLRRRHPDLQIVNAGVDRYDLSQEYRLALRLWGTFRPCHVVLAVYLGNDVVDYDHEAEARPPWQGGGVRVWIREHSYLYHFVRGALRGRRRHSKPAAAPSVVEGWSPRSVPGFGSLTAEEQDRIRGQFAAEDVLPVLRGGEEGARRLRSTGRMIAAFGALARERGAGFTLVLIPMKQEVIPEQRAEWMALQGIAPADLERLRRGLLDVAAEQGLAAVDVTSALAAQPHPETLFWNVDLHMNRRGHAALADALALAVDRGLGDSCH